MRRGLRALLVAPLLLLIGADQTNDVGDTRFADFSGTTIWVTKASLDSRGQAMSGWARVLNFTVIGGGTGAGTLTLGLHMGNGWNELTFPDDVVWDRDHQLATMSFIDAQAATAKGDTVAYVTCSSTSYLILAGS